MVKAIELSIKSVDSGTGPFGAVIVKDNKIISEGFNIVTSSNDPTSHAEIVAIRNACKSLNNFVLKGCDLYTTCEPCPMCLGALYWSQISRIVYSAKDKKNEFNGFQSKIHPKTTIEGGVLANQTEIMLKEFFKSKRS